VKALLRKSGSLLALLAGIALIYFEWRRSHAITADNAFWLLIGALIVILATLNLANFAPPKPPDNNDMLPR